jgi:hypothetical protein
MREQNRSRLSWVRRNFDVLSFFVCLLKAEIFAQCCYLSSEVKGKALPEDLSREK